MEKFTNYPSIQETYVNQDPLSYPRSVSNREVPLPCIIYIV